METRTLRLPTYHEASRVSPENIGNACAANAMAALPGLSQIPTLQASDFLAA